MSPTETVLPPGVFMDIDRSGPIPLYYQVASRIEHAISAGHLPPGSRLENEVALGERLGLSRPTVRRALQELVDKGLLVRRRGIGTQVVQGRVTRNMELTSLYEDLVRAKQKPSTRMLLREVVGASDEVANRLGIEPETAVLHVRRIRLTDLTPVAILENYLRGDFVDITTADLEEFGLYQLLRGRGVSIRVAQQRISARDATGEESRLLEIGKSGAMLTMDRTAFDHTGRAIEYGHHCYRPDLYAFEVTLVDK